MAYLGRRGMAPLNGVGLGLRSSQEVRSAGQGPNQGGTASSMAIAAMQQPRGQEPELKGSSGDPGGFSVTAAGQWLQRTPGKGVSVTHSLPVLCRVISCRAVPGTTRGIFAPVALRLTDMGLL